MMILVKVNSIEQYIYTKKNYSENNDILNIFPGLKFY